MIKVVWNVIKKIFGIICMIFSPLKRLWCRRKRRNSDPILPMTNHYPSVENLSSHYTMNGTGQVQEELSPWDSWDEQKQAEKIRSVEEYRQRQHQLQQQQSQEQEHEMDYFQDMAPRVKKQKKVLIKKKEDYSSTGSISNKLAATGDIPLLQTSELGSWEDTGNAWEAEADEDLSWQAENVIKETRKAERQQRHLQQQLKKQEREQHKHVKSQNPLTAVRLS
ncbi:receptor-binding cancer antigen expressed on SiSo cells-like [Mercenaria mercenaria]|uniref:receptor-binding cancer antigen expressed on SiSo cells-like n=1 Tax=Mercenaria mercenaria TaxID=6596 RepID=UPI00234F7694|nr:receptor-binding cancer antigen expressed on SiSo cells-like [Mercenaria mercenaria]